MTRDKAIEIFAHTKVHMHGARGAGDWIDAFAALGILTLEDPKGLDARLAGALGWPENGRSHGELSKALQDAGLELVEK